VDVGTEHGSADRMSARTDTLAVPAALDLPDPGRRFSAKGMSRRLNVLFLVSQPITTPAMSVHANLMRFLDTDRVRVHVLYNRLAAHEPYRSNGTSVLRILPQSPEVVLKPADFGPVGGAPSGRLLAAAGRAVVPAVRDSLSLLGYIRRHRIDIIHCDEGSRNGFYGYLLSRITRAKSLVHFHSQYGSWISPLSKLGVHRADALITVSSWTGRGIAQAGVPPERIFPVLNGIEVEKWNPAGISGEAIRREFGVEPDDPLVVMVAQLVEWKRQTTMIEAFAGVVAEYPKARLLLVGKEWNPAAGPDGITYGERLGKLVAERGLERHVTFIGHRRDLPQLLTAADIFALPSVGDPFGLAHVEAMAMGKPVVGVRAGGAPEIIEDGETGLLGTPDDSEQLASNLNALIADPARRRQMGAHGRDRVLDYFNAQRMADDVEAVYRLLTGAEQA
jgi:glycosyltransferase involved in cell wall biosynthesis